MVGPFAVLIDASTPGLNFTKVIPECDSNWSDITVALRAAGFQIMTTKQLAERVPLTLALCGSGCTVFNALFRDQAVHDMR